MAFMDSIFGPGFLNSTASSSNFYTTTTTAATAATQSQMPFGYVYGTGYYQAQPYYPPHLQPQQQQAAVQQAAVPRARMETALQWLDRRVDEVRCKL